MILSCVIGGIPGVVAKGFFRFSWRIREPYGCPIMALRNYFPKDVSVAERVSSDCLESDRGEPD